LYIVAYCNNHLIDLNQCTTFRLTTIRIRIHIRSRRILKVQISIRDASSHRVIETLADNFFRTTGPIKFGCELMKLNIER